MGSTERLAQLPTEARNPRSERLDELSTLEMMQVINDEDATVAAAVREALPAIAAAVDAIAERFSRGGRLFYVGAGTSGRLGVLDASECPPTFSVAPELFVGLIAGRRLGVAEVFGAERGLAGAGSGDLADAWVEGGGCGGWDCGERANALCAGGAACGGRGGRVDDLR